MTSRADMNGTMGIDHHRGSRSAVTEQSLDLLPGQKVVFLFFAAFSSFVNTKEEKANPRPPIRRTTLFPRRGEGENLGGYCNSSRSFSTARFSRREICTWETPRTRAASDWVMALK